MADVDGVGAILAIAKSRQIGKLCRGGNVVLVFEPEDCIVYPRQGDQLD